MRMAVPLGAIWPLVVFDVVGDAVVVAVEIETIVNAVAIAVASRSWPSKTIVFAPLAVISRLFCQAVNGLSPLRTTAQSGAPAIAEYNLLCYSVRAVVDNT